ncbi:SLEI domain protein, PF07620 family [Leptospira kirschneri serovar Grippotyphosa str. RM52]|nr:SLEI domain protein, PF07620 family [Leptospira kirschneri serovar Grippotyphosa str. RM52]
MNVGTLIFRKIFPYIEFIINRVFEKLIFFCFYIELILKPQRILRDSSLEIFNKMQ